MENKKKAAPIFSNLWVSFFLFLAADLVLSYFAIPGEEALLVGLGCLALPLGLALGRGRVGSFPGDPSGQDGFVFPIPLWVWFVLGLLSVGIRFYKLTALSVWPLYDEGMYGAYAARLSQHWDWKFFFGPSQAPPFYLWGLSFFFKLFGVSLWTLWFFPALISLCLVPAGYWAARQFLSPSLSFICGCLFALSFWPVYVGRFGVMTGLVLLAECLVLGLLGGFLKEPDEKKQGWKALGLGIGTGLGFYTYLHWPVMAAMVYLTVFLSLRPRFPEKPYAFLKLYGIFLTASLITALPLAMAFVREGGNQYGDYLRHLFAASHGFHAAQWGIALSYLRSLFWGMDLSFYTYQPVWGGYLNPLLGALFFIGLLELFHYRKTPLAHWLFWSFLLFVLPGVLTSERATSRLILVFPILAVLVSFGVVRLLSNRPRAKVWLLGMALLSMGLDAYHLTSAYPQVWKSLDHWRGYEKSYARYQAYLRLQSIAAEKGPGYIWADFIPSLSDQTLAVATFGFNASQNQEIQRDKVTWAAVLTNVNYQPFLKKRFPEGKAYWVSKDLSIPDGGWMLWVFPVTPSTQKTVERWQAASQSLAPFIERNLCYVPGQPFSSLSGELEKAYPLFQGDPFLESSYWEKLADVAQRQAFGAMENPASPDIAGSIQYLSLAVHRGYPAAHLYRDLGADEMMANNVSKARAYLEEARRCPLDFTDARKILNE
jgi:4-amino-4-deoxy-L-arabinose transferase-like glycosyltransferase